MKALVPWSREASLNCHLGKQLPCVAARLFAKLSPNKAEKLHLPTKLFSNSVILLILNLRPFVGQPATAVAEAALSSPR